MTNCAIDAYRIAVEHQKSADKISYGKQYHMTNFMMVYHAVDKKTDIIIGNRMCSVFNDKKSPANANGTERATVMHCHTLVIRHLSLCQRRIGWISQILPTTPLI